MADELINVSHDVVIQNNQNLTIPISNVDKGELPKYWDRDYISRIIDSVHNPSRKMFFMFMWMTGVRISEALMARKMDINFSEYMISIRWLKNRKYLYRYLPLHPNLKDLLQLYTAQMLAEDRLFPFGRIWGYKLVKRYFGGHPHQFRHSFAVNWLRCGGDMVILCRFLGHSNIKTTMEYLKIVPIDQGKELLKIRFR
jgi:integrase